jgi:hypothetical protein
VLYQSEITLHCVIDLFPGKKSVLEHLLYKSHSPEHSFPGASSYPNCFRRNQCADERNRKPSRANASFRIQFKVKFFVKKSLDFGAYLVKFFLVGP